MPISLRDSKILIPLLCFLAGGLITIGAVWLYGSFLTEEADGQPTEGEEVVIEPTLPPKPSPDRVSGRYLMTGTIVWDRGIEVSSRRADGSIDYEYPFRGLSTYKPENYDAWLADLECPISSDDVPVQLGHTLLEFNCLPEFLPYAKKYFQFFNLSNNHADNSGQEKLQDTRRLLEAVGIQHFGDPEPGRQDLSCEVVALPVKLWDTAGQFQAAEIPAAFCAWCYFHRLPLEGEIEVMKQYAELMPVFAFMHMGAEYAASADGVQRSLAHRVIDAGADFVIANNPHWVQNAELYKDKLIVYSTGNFIFDQAFNEEVKRSANIVVDVSADYEDQALAGWLELGPACAVSGDNCLERARAAGLEKFAFDISFDVVAGYLTNNQQAVADPSVQEAVRQRLGWEVLFSGEEED